MTASLIPNTSDKPLATAGLASYRIRGQYGWIMIGAKDSEDAWREAQRSANNLKRENLEVWNGSTYEPM